MKKTKSDAIDDVDSSKALYPIEIDPVNYSGVYYFKNDKGVDIPYRYKNRISLDTGQHFIGIGGDYQTSFDILADGTIANISNNDALMAQRNKLIFKNVSVEIDPQQYVGAYFPSIFHRLVDELKTDKQTFVFVPALEYYVELYDSGYGNEIRFQVDRNGDVQNISNPGAVFVRGKSLVFYNVKAVINPITFAQNYVFAKQVRKYQSELTLVPNTRLLIYIAENVQNFVQIKNTHIEPAFLDLKDYSNASHKFLFAIKPDVAIKHRWRAENNADDSYGTSSSTVSPPVTYVDGIDGKAFNFTGTGYIKVTNPFETEVGAVDFWFKWNGGYNQVLMGSCITNVPPMRPGCDNRAPLFAIFDGARFSWEFSDQFNLVDYQIQQNIWYHVYFTYASHSGGYAIAFYNRPQNEPTDKLIYAKFDNIAPISSFNTYYGIGKGTENVSGNGFNGIIDEVKIFGNPSPPTKQKSKRKSK
jgi:hypothetical protein